MLRAAAVFLGGVGIAGLLIVETSASYPSVAPVAAASLCVIGLCAILIVKGSVEWILFAMVFNMMIGSARLLEGPLLNVNRLMGLVIVFVLVIDCLILKRRSIRFSMQGAWVLCFAAAVALSVFFSVNIGESISELRVYVRVFVLYFLITNIIVSVESLRRFMCTLMAAAIALTLFAIIDSWSFSVYGAPIADKLGIAAFDSGSMRAIVGHRDPTRLYGALGSTTDVNYFALILVSLLPLTTALVGHEKKKYVVCSYWGAAATFVGVLFSLSRGALLALLLALIVLIKRSLIPRKVLFVGLAIAAVSVPALSTRSLERVYSTFLYPLGVMPKDPTDLNNVRNRIGYIKAGVQMFLDHPLSGVGVGNFPRQYVKYAPPGALRQVRAAHNTYLQVLAETGVLGFLPFVWGILLCFRSTQVTRREAFHKGDQDIYRIASVTEISLLAFLVSGFFVSAAYLDIFWILIACTACLRFMVQEPSASGEAKGVQGPLRSAPRGLVGTP